MARKRRDRKTRKRKPPAGDGGRKLVRLGVLAAVLWALVALAQIQYVVPDSAGYVSYGRSILWDRDLDFSNDYAHFGSIVTDGSIEFAVRTATGKLGNPFAMGCGILWIPFLMLSALVGVVLSSLGLNVATNGFGTMALWSVNVGTWSYALLAFVLMSRTLARFVVPDDAAARRAALAGAVLGTPLIYYVVQLPTFSHTCSAFVVALLVYLSLQWREEWTHRRALMLGAVLGLGGLVRGQELLFWFFPILVAWEAGALRPDRRTAVRVAAYSGAALAVFSLQLGAWVVIYGTIFHTPQGGGFFHFSVMRIVKVLFHSRHGWLAWSPVAALAVAGWALLVRRPGTRYIGLAALVAFAVQTVMNSLPFDWWAGWSFGARRFTDLVPVVAIGLAPMAARGRWVRGAIYTLAGASLVQWLRIAAGALRGDADPGWNWLWGKGFFGFLGDVPGAISRLVAVPWSVIKVWRRPAAIPPDFHQDSIAAVTVFLLVWGVLVLVAARWMEEKS